MIAYEPIELIITRETVYIHTDHLGDFRRIYTDGRDWPAKITPSFEGHSIGKWVDEDGDGRYDVLETETRALKGPRTFDADGLPLHKDNQTVVKGTDLPRQGQPRPLSRRNHNDRPCAAPPPGR